MGQTLGVWGVAIPVLVVSFKEPPLRKPSPPVL